MEDRNLQRKKSQRRKNRIKKKRKSKLFRRMLLLLVLAAVLYLLIRLGISLAGNLMKSSNESSKNTNESIQSKSGEVVNDKEKDNTDDAEVKPSLSLDTKEEESKEKKPPVDTNITVEVKKEAFDKKINEFVQEKKLVKEKLSIGYFNLDKDESFGLNEKAEYGVGRSNDYMIGMAVYDIVKAEKLDINKELDLLVEKPANQTDDNNEPTSKKYAIKELIKMMIQLDSQEAKNTLIKFIEDKSSKYWYDELNSRYGINISYTNQMTAEDSMKMLRKLFSVTRQTAEERIKTKEEKGLQYQELINFMTVSESSSNISRDIMLKSQFSEKVGSSYEDRALTGFVLGKSRYIYVVLSAHNDTNVVYDALNAIDEWHNYYYK